MWHKRYRKINKNAEKGQKMYFDGALKARNSQILHEMLKNEFLLLLSMEKCLEDTKKSLFRGAGKDLRTNIIGFTMDTKNN